MTESVIADFTGRFVVPDSGPEPVQGRIVLSQRRLVLASDGGKTTIPLSEVFDVVVGQVPPEMREFFNDSVTVAYRSGGGQRVAVVESDGEKIEKFVTVLFKVQLNGLEATVEHPARVGGRINESAAPRQATLYLDADGVTFESRGARFTVDLAVVSDFAKTNRTLEGTKRPVIAVRHVPDGTALLTLVSLPSSRQLNLLGRYLRIEYDEMRAEMEDVDLSDDEVAVLTGVYSAGGSGKLASMLDLEPSRLTMLLNSLEEKDLVVTGDETKLSPMGRTVVNTRIEDVNS